MSGIIIIGMCGDKNVAMTERVVDVARVATSE
jgi:hypothetical protein